LILKPTIRLHGNQSDFVENNNLKKSKYLEIVEHYESCLEQHGDSHLGVDWPRESDINTRFNVMLDVVGDDPSEKISLLDFGCGLSHLLDYIQTKNLSKIQYSGLDLSSKFTDFSKEKHLNNTFYYIDILTDSMKLPEFDYIIMNGVFTQKRDLTFEEMFDYFKKLISAVSEKAKKGIAFNVMSKQVDWEKDGSFHLSFDLLADFLTQQISKDFTFRHNYGLYEYTTYVYKN
jgi:hypothetical protein